MKTFVLFLFLPVAAIAQQRETCSKSLILYSRELFPGKVTVARAEALTTVSSDCAGMQPEKTSMPSFQIPIGVKFHYFSPQHTPQDMNGRDIYLGVITDQLVNHLVFDRK